MSAKVEVQPYDGKTDFGVWSIKMRALLSHHKVAIALQGDEDKWTNEQKAKKDWINEEAFNLLVLNLSDQVLRRVSQERTALKVWNRLESLFSNIQAPNLAYLKASVYAYKMDSSKTVDDNLDDFLKMTLRLSDTELALDDKTIVMILMNAMPDNYQPVRNAFQYTGTLPSYDTLCTAMRTRENKLKSLKAKTGSGLFVKGKTKGNNNYNKGKNDNKGQNTVKDNSDQSKDKDQKESRKCYHCGKVGHLKKAKKKAENNNANVATVAIADAGCAEVLTVMNRNVTDE